MAMGETAMQGREPAAPAAMRAKHYWLGITFVGVFVVISSAREVYFGHLVQSLEPLLVAFACFGLSTMVLAGGYALSGGGFRRDILAARMGDVIWINIGTAVAWIGGLVALQYIEPAIQNATVTAVGPAITVAAGAWGRSRRILGAEVWTSVAIAVVILLMSVVSITSRSGVGDVPPDDVVIATACSVAAGAGIVAQTIYAKRLGEAGLATAYVVAIRFVLLVFVSGVYTFIAIPSAAGQLVSSAGILTVLSVVGIVVPLYALQRGIERSEPITVALIVALAPTLIFCMQAFDARLSMSPYTLIGVGLTTALVALSVFIRHRSIR